MALCIHFSLGHKSSWQSVWCVYLCVYFTLFAAQHFSQLIYIHKDDDYTWIIWMWFSWGAGWEGCIKYLLWNHVLLNQAEGNRISFPDFKIKNGYGTKKISGLSADVQVRLVISCHFIEHGDPCKPAFHLHLQLPTTNWDFPHWTSFNTSAPLHIQRKETAWEVLWVKDKYKYDNKCNMTGSGKQKKSPSSFNCYDSVDMDSNIKHH